jgi:rhodanese-related sulfurtransferase
MAESFGFAEQSNVYRSYFQMDSRRAAMTLIVICIAALVVALLLGLRVKRARERRELEQYSVGPEALHELLSEDKKIKVFDVRLPLDLLAYSEIIPGATRVPPKDIMANPSLIPEDEDAVVYCTCPDDKTSLMILRRALRLNFSRLKVLRGGLAGWKAKGFPVEPYKDSFRLDTGV